MARFFDVLSDDQCAFIARQPLFFVATAAAGGRVNLSPKGMDCFRVLGPDRIAYLDVAGSGNETHAHLVADGRITLMFVLGQRAHFTLLPGTRQIFDMTVESVQTSCGWGVPHMRFERERETLAKYHATHDSALRLAKYAVRTHSIDGLPVRNPTQEPR